MRIDSECHVRITELHPCGCMHENAKVRTLTGAHVFLETRPVYKRRWLRKRLDHMTLSLRIDGVAAWSTLPEHSRLELWTPNDLQPAGGYSHLEIKHIHDGLYVRNGRTNCQHEPRNADSTLVAMRLPEAAPEPPERTS